LNCQFRIGDWRKSKSQTNKIDTREEKKIRDHKFKDWLFWCHSYSHYSLQFIFSFTWIQQHSASAFCFDKYGPERNWTVLEWQRRSKRIYITELGLNVRDHWTNHNEQVLWSDRSMTLTNDYAQVLWSQEGRTTLPSYRRIYNADAGFCKIFSDDNIYI
jgi:hypothetical protein